LTAFGSNAEAADEFPIDFGTQIRPILSEKCFHCHGPDEATRESGLRLDTEEVAIDDYAAFVSGDLEASSAWDRIHSDDPDLVMPPPSTGETITDFEKELIEQWILEGARWGGHWAFEAPVRTAPPTSTAPTQSRHNVIDAFVHAALATSSLTPSETAEPREIVRRLYLDLIGIPPTPEEVEQFVDNRSPNAVSQLVDRLLAHPGYGEKWGRQWLDAARYADSDGFEKDKPRSVWFYRDWVVHAMNSDKPYDEFVVQQIAGDMLPNPSQEDRVATGFLRNSMINEEGGADPEQFRVEAMFDRMDAIGKSILGLTISCAQCHDHKFDPLTQRDYYRMFAAINDSSEGSISVYNDADRARKDAALAAIQALEDSIKSDTPNWSEKLADWENRARNRDSDWVVIQPEWEANSLGGEKLLPQPDGSFLAQGYAPTKRALSGTTTFDNSNRLNAPITAVRIECIPDANLPRGGPGRSIFGTGVVSEIRLYEVALSKDGGETLSELAFDSVTASTNPTRKPLPDVYDDRSNKERVIGPASYAIDGDELTGWSLDLGPIRTHQTQTAVFKLSEPLELSPNAQLRFQIVTKHGGWNSDDNQTANLGRFRLSLTDAVNPVADPFSAEIRQLIENKNSATRSDSENSQVFRAWIKTEDAFNAANAQIESEWSKIPWGESQLVLNHLAVPRPTAILERGEFLRPTKLVSAGTPEFLHTASTDRPAMTRLEFANWLVSDASPTTARTIVNRIWQAYFGIGLSSTTEDFGSQSEIPSHPKLLDSLAVLLMENDWSLKRLHYEIATSMTYLQSSKVSIEDYELDPKNRLLARGPRQRLQGESLRDTILSISGLLTEQVGGRPTNPPAPQHLFQPPTSYGPKVWNESYGSDRYRRSLYTFRFRSVPYPPLQVFDTPNGDASCIRRSQSNTPLQALTSLNEIVFMEAAQSMARIYVGRQFESDSHRLASMFEAATNRVATAQELKTLNRSLQMAIASFESRDADGSAQTSAENASPEATKSSSQTTPSRAAQIVGLDSQALASIPIPNVPTDELAGWVLISRVILNLDEVITK
jgi:hypothetical protein